MRTARGGDKNVSQLHGGVGVGLGAGGGGGWAVSYRMEADRSYLLASGIS